MTSEDSSFWSWLGGAVREKDKPKPLPTTFKMKWGSDVSASLVDTFEASSELRKTVADKLKRDMEDSLTLTLQVMKNRFPSSI